MKVKMQVYISGTRNGEAWPAAGGEVDLPDAEAAKYCANGLAIPVRSDDAAVETRAPRKQADEAGDDKPERKKPGPKPKT